MSPSGFPENSGLKYDQLNCGTCTGGACGCIESCGFAGGLDGFGGGSGGFPGFGRFAGRCGGLEDVLVGLVTPLVVLGLVLALGD